LPKETFYNLPQEKRDRIIAAIKKELARAPLEEISINKIIQDAGISRGSFYMYFEDKKDMLHCIFSDFRDRLLATIEESARQNDGDLFSIFSDILKFTAEFGTKKENIDFCMNVFARQRLQSDILLKFANRRRRSDFSDWFGRYANTRKLNLHKPEDLYSMIDILATITKKAIADIFLSIEDKDSILEEYNNKINILKRGMLKESNNACT
jgi:AcrR family transcriptional regulator